MVDKKYIDANVFVYWLGNHPSFGKIAYEWIKKAESSRQKEYVTSSLTVYETLVIMAGLSGGSQKDPVLVKGVISPITSLKGLLIEPVTCTDFDEAITLMGKYNLDYEDALHLSVALRVGSSSIVTNDKDFQRTDLRTVF